MNRRESGWKNRWSGRSVCVGTVTYINTDINMNMYAARQIFGIATAGFLSRSKSLCELIVWLDKTYYFSRSNLDHKAQYEQVQ